jgi:multidrug transporter EmrE-like cation transporter
MNIVLLISAAVFAAAGQIFLKQSAVGGSTKEVGLVTYFISLLASGWSWLAVLSYGISFGLYMIALRRVELSTARSFSALSYVFVIAVSVIIFRDSITPLKIIGVVLIAAGVLFVGLSTTR